MELARLNRWVLSWSIIGLASASLLVFAVSAALHIGAPALVGTSEEGAIDQGAAVGGSLAGSVPSPDQPGPSAR